VVKIDGEIWLLLWQTDQGLVYDVETLELKREITQVRPAPPLPPPRAAAAPPPGRAADPCPAAAQPMARGNKNGKGPDAWGLTLNTLEGATAEEELIATDSSDQLYFLHRVPPPRCLPSLPVLSPSPPSPTRRCAGGVERDRRRTVDGWWSHGGRLSMTGGRGSWCASPRSAGRGGGVAEGPHDGGSG
jgi:hypothetical protein